MQDELPIKNFLGLNVRDAADKVKDNEFVQLQNVWQPSQGVLSLRFGSVSDSSSFPMASRISGVWRHPRPDQQNISLYHCVPDATQLPDNTTDLTLTDVVDATSNIFGGGAVVAIRVCYSWIGRGMEQTYNSKNRASYPAPGAFPMWPSANPAHQSITLGGAGHRLDVTIPAFPTGIVGANIFIALGNNSAFGYAGTVTTSSGTLSIKEFLGPNAAFKDTITLPNDPVPLNNGTNGKLTPGVYYVSFAWCVNPGYQEGSGLLFFVGTEQLPIITVKKTVSVLGNNNAITVTAPTANSTNGAKALYVFLSAGDPASHPAVCVGIVRVNTTMVVNSIPAHNAQSVPQLLAVDTGITGGGIAYFWNAVNDGYEGGLNYSVGQRVQSRFGFIVAKRSGVTYEVFPSRSMNYFVPRFIAAPVYQGDGGNLVFTGTWSYDFRNYVQNIRTENDKYQLVISTGGSGGFVQPYQWNYTVSDPQFCYHLGLSYFANGVDIPWQTDGFSLGQLGKVAAATNTLLPPIPRFIFSFKDSLIAAGSLAESQVWASNANAPNNWATGGTGTLGRFISIGDTKGAGVTAEGIFTPATEATSNPSSFLISFKKTGTWMISNVPDPVTSTIAGVIGGQIASPMTQVSARIGCVAYRSIVQSSIGTLFLGQDANVYLIRAVQEPVRIGTKIQNFLTHLVGNDAAMRSVTAVYHDRHYKMSYPSAAAAAITPIVNDMELWADLRTEEGSIKWFGPHSGRNIGSQVVLALDGDDESRLVCDSALVRTYTADSVSSITDLDDFDNPKKITLQITSKIYRGKESRFKRIFGAILDMFIDFSYSNTILFEGFSDSNYNSVNRQLSNGGGVWDSSQWDQTTYADAVWEGFSFNFAQNNLVGRTFQWRLTKTDAAPFVLASTTVLSKTERRRIIN